MTTAYQLRCRECGKTYGHRCFPSVMSVFLRQVAYDLEYARTRFTRDAISQGPQSMWRYRALLPVSDSYVSQTPSGFTPLVMAPRLGAQIGARNLPRA